MELVTGIAAASGGQCVLVSSEERLQTKVCVAQSRELCFSPHVIHWCCHTRTVNACNVYWSGCRQLRHVYRPTV